MNYPFIISPETQLDIEDAFEWYSTQNPKLGSEFVRAIDSAISKIGTDPFAYPVIHRQTRRILLRRFPHRLFYTINQEQQIISIVGCFHGKRDPKTWRDRL